MAVTSNARLIKALLEQMSADGQYSSESFTGAKSDVLFGLREMLLLGLIIGDFEYSEACDPLGPLLASASSVRLTKRGECMK